MKTILIFLIILSLIIYFMYNIITIINVIYLIYIDSTKEKINGVINYTTNNILFEFNHFKNETRKKQTELEEIINSLAVENKELQKITKTYLKQIALDYIKKHEGVIGPHWFQINTEIKNIDQKIVNDLTDYAYNYYLENLDNLIKIDYDNFFISFSYFSNDQEENYKKIMKIFFNEDIIFDKKNIVEFIGGNTLTYFRYYYKFIVILVMPPVKFI